MAIHWQIKFKSLRAGTLYTVNIYDANYSGNPVQLRGADQPFITEEDKDDDMFKPIRTQSGIIRYIQEDASVSIIPINATDMPVQVVDEDGNVWWNGFINGEREGLPFDGTPYEMELPVVSILGCASNVPFEAADDKASLLGLLSQMAAYVPGGFDVIRPYVTGLALLNAVYVNGANWKDATVGDVLIDFAKYFGVTISEYKGNIIIYRIDYNTYKIAHFDNIYNYTSYTDFGNKSIAASNFVSDNCEQSLSRAYRRIVGEFKTGDYGESNILFQLPDFLSTMEVGYIMQRQADLYSSFWGAAVFYGNDIFQEYENGMATTIFVWVNGGPDSQGWGGSVIYKTSEDQQMLCLASRYNKGIAYQDSFNPELLKVEVGRYFNPTSQQAYLNLRITAKLFEIVGNQSSWARSEMEEGILRFRIVLYADAEHSYSLHSTWVENSGRYAYTWYSGTTSTCTIAFKGGQIDDDLSSSSIGLPVPTTSGPWWYDVSITFLDYATEDIPSQSAEITSLEVAVTYDKTFTLNTVPTTAESNVFTVENNNNYPQTYNVDCNITTMRGLQRGAGLVISDDLGGENRGKYYTGEPDREGTTLKAQYLARPRQMLQLEVDRNAIEAGPLDTISVAGASGQYKQLSKDIDWRDDNLRITLIEK